MRVSPIKWRLHLQRRIDDAKPGKCAACRGRGWVRLWHPRDGEVPTDKGLCWDCRGTGAAGYDAIAAAIRGRKP